MFSLDIAYFQFASPVKNSHVQTVDHTTGLLSGFAGRKISYLLGFSPTFSYVGAKFLFFEDFT